MSIYYYLKNYYFFYLLCFSQYIVLFSIENNIQNIKVLLHKLPIEEYKKSFFFENAIKINDLNDKENFHLLNEPCVLSYHIEKKSWYLNNKKLKINNIELSANENQHIIFEKNQYEGEIIIQNDDKYIYIINNINLELYVASVVAKEFYSVWNYEALKTAAIIVRTYALYQIESSRKSKNPFHIKSSIEHQKYTGKNKDTKIYNDVNETKNKKDTKTYSCHVSYLLWWS